MTSNRVFRVWDRLVWRFDAVDAYANRRAQRQADEVKRRRAYERAQRDNAARERWIEAGRRRGF